ncbi:cupin domain-containing protein [Terriglobus roseus]|uniref:Cupin domain-containing protein n=1 Tax=Terriglobus roseus TaxID=392734 RepID=A0A1G7QGE5_9BACT|nr:cupin domain-containing protein [Terriglobus roseus]SDF97562.1 Cupin domain-containing protein [Terriglobus roseus]
MLKVIPADDSKMTVPEPGLRRQVMATTEPMMLVRHRMEPGWVGAAHSHPHEQLIYILSGEIALVVDGETYLLHAGDSVMVPGGVVHQASAAVESEVLDVFTPAREDYRL